LFHPDKISINTVATNPDGTNNVSDTITNGSLSLTPSHFDVFTYAFIDSKNDDKADNVTDTITNGSLSLTPSHFYVFTYAFIDSKNDDKEEKDTATSLLVHPSAAITMRLTTSPSDGLTDDDWQIAFNYPPDTIFQNNPDYPEDLQE
jgi:hypothetical protein